MAATGAATASASQMIFGGEDQKTAFPIKILVFDQFFHCHFREKLELPACRRFSIIRGFQVRVKTRTVRQ